MRPERDELLDDLFSSEELRQMTLHSGMKILRRKRRLRIARKIAALMILVAAMVIVLDQSSKTLTVQTVVRNTKPTAAVKVKYLTDDELLALFPDAPVGLAKLPNGKKVLIFPRAADEAKYISRL